MNNKHGLRVLALEPYYGGSHKYFIDGWIKRSQHKFTLLTLPPYKWSWRMRHAAITFAEIVAEKVAEGEEWDVIFCSDMLNLASFSGLLPEKVRDLPKIIYFHENQLTYPVQEHSKLDYQSVFINLISAIAADKVWFNSAFNMNSFLGELPRFLKKMPDYKLLNKVDEIKEKSSIHPLGIDLFPPRKKRIKKIPHILWAARWEFDKNPEDFFNALTILQKKGLQFNISVLGEKFRTYPPVFDEAAISFENNILNWGFVSRETYNSVLKEADIVVSTAIHEFFGLTVLEAVSAGAYPVLPKRLAYPEIFADSNNQLYADFFYGETAEDLACKLEELLIKLELCNDIWYKTNVSAIDLAKKYHWENIVTDLDQKLKGMENYKISEVFNN